MEPLNEIKTDEIKSIKEISSEDENSSRLQTGHRRIPGRDWGREGRAISSRRLFMIDDNNSCDIFCSKV